MGSKSSKNTFLKPHEIYEYSKITSFSNEQINHLYTHFKKISKLERDDGVIDIHEFCSALKMPKCILTERIFAFFDVNHDDVINFREFITAISMLVQETLDSQIKLTFNIFDFDHNGKIYKESLIKLIKSSIELSGNTIKIDDEVIKNNVDMTYSALNHHREDISYIDYNQYKKMIRQNPIILNWLFVDLEKMKASAQQIIKNPKILSKQTKSMQFVWYAIFSIQSYQQANNEWVLKTLLNLFFLNQVNVALLANPRCVYKNLQIKLLYTQIMYRLILTYSLL